MYFQHIYTCRYLEGASSKEHDVISMRKYLVKLRTWNIIHEYQQQHFNKQSYNVNSLIYKNYLPFLE